MADVKLPNISHTNLNPGAASQPDVQQIYNSEGAAVRSEPPNRSQSFHSGRGAFGQVGRSIVEAKKQRKE